MPEQTWDNIRDPELLGSIIGQTILDVTQDEWPASEDKERPDPACVYLHLSNGKTLAFVVRGRAGFCYPWEP
jgi:hypothetical protein